MKYDVILAGVGGQGVLSISAIIASSAMKEGLFVKQSEVHGMSQRGGAVYTNLRISDEPIHSDLIPAGTASLLLSMEPLESLRYVHYLAEGAHLITSSNPELNISDYPDLKELLEQIRLIPNAKIIDTQELARSAGSTRATNMVIAGAASHYLPIKTETMEEQIRDLFGRKGEKVVETNLKAFRTGRES
ncbi:MAG: indolepyruvate oxidoreductase subunit beta [Calditrichaceae bacterium]